MEPVEPPDKIRVCRPNPEYDAYRQSGRWLKLRRAVQLRAKGRCEVCRRRDGTDLAHLTYDRMFNELITDMLWLCRGCHREVDGRDAPCSSERSG